VLKGNLAPEGAVVKQSAVSANMMKFEGTAVVFDAEETAMKAILDGKIKKGSVVVIRYEGPKGGPGASPDRGLHRGDKQGVRDHGKGMGQGKGQGPAHRNKEAGHHGGAGHKR